ncbi:hypothetical protein [Paenibacillus turpanensis]|nr:hypothetical protein [Paenibacillus turpanensis]
MGAGYQYDERNRLTQVINDVGKTVGTDITVTAYCTNVQRME